MATAKITIIGFENYLNDKGLSLFDEMIIPESPLINRDALINHILLKCGEFEVLYAQPYFLRGAIGIWSQVQKRTFEKWVEGLDVSYNPIENYDRMEEWSDVNSNRGSSTQSSVNIDTGSQTTNDTRSAFDSDTMRPNTSTTTTTDNSSSVDGTVASEDSGTNIHTGRIHGNIGVTTSAAMQREFLDMAVWNLYDHIAILFQQEFTIPIYE